MNKGTLSASWVVVLGLGLTGCVTTAPEREIVAGAPAPHGGDGGVVIAEAKLVPSVGQQVGEALADCNGPDMGVAVAGSGGENHYLFGTDGEPCGKAVTLFDGTDPVDTRPPPPSVHIAFRDQLGSQPSTAITMPRIELGVDSDPVTPEEFALGAAGTKPTHTETQDGMNLETTVARWQALRQNEKLFADLRDVERMSTGELVTTQQDKILELQAKLNEAKAQEQQTKVDGARLQADIERLRQQTEAKGMNWEQREDQMTSEMRELKRRLSEYERRNQELAKAQEAKEAAHKARVAKLESDLQAAEREADDARREMVLDAAKKIAEAERLAFAARMAEKEAMQREAARKRQESDMLLERALRLKQGKTVLVPGLSDQLGEGKDLAPLPMALEKMPVNVHAEGQTLQKLMDALLKEIQPLAGNWRVSWQLSADHKFLLDETWSLTAEADFGEVLAFVTKRIKETHNISLQFEQFDKIRLLVISDGSDAPGIKPETPEILR